MAHYAFLDQNYIVTDVIVGHDEGSFNWENHYEMMKAQTCKRTSYNTQGGIHKEDGTPFRKNFAIIGYKYDIERDAFIPPKPYDSWILNEETCLWESPVPYPTNDKMYSWDEENKNWIKN